MLLLLLLLLMGGGVRGRGGCWGGAWVMDCVAGQGGVQVWRGLPMTHGQCAGVVWG